MTILVVGILLAAIVMFMTFSTRSFTAMYNYVELDDHNRLAMDQLTRDIRQCKRVVTCNPHELIVLDDDDLPLAYTFHPDREIPGYGRGVLVRVKNNGVEKVMLKGCDRLNFQVGQRNAINGSYEIFPAATAASAKVVNVSWLCSRTIFGRKENTESVQTARIVIRKQGT